MTLPPYVPLETRYPQGVKRSEASRGGGRRLLFSETHSPLYSTWLHVPSCLKGGSASGVPHARPPKRPQSWGTSLHEGSSLIRKRHTLGPCRRLMPRVLGGSQVGERFLMGEVPLHRQVLRNRLLWFIFRDSVGIVYWSLGCRVENDFWGAGGGVPVPLG